MMTIKTLFIVCSLVFVISSSRGQEFKMVDKQVLDKSAKERFENEIQFNGIEISTMIVLKQNEYFVVGWKNGQNIAGLYDKQANLFETVYFGDKLDETHLIRSAIYSNNDNSKILISTKYGYPEMTVGVKYFLYVDTSLNYLGNIDHLKQYASELFSKEFNAPFDELAVNETDNILTIIYPPGEYVEHFDIVSGNYFENGIKFEYIENEFVKRK